MYSVLIVEDDPMVSAIVREFVERNAVLSHVVALSNGQAALDHLQDHEVDLILLDYYMPKMNGQEFLRAIRARGITADVIMVTAANDADSISSLYVYGVTDYLVKPFTRERFQAAISRFLMRREVLKSDNPLSQEEIDRLNVSLGPTAATPAYMEKGIQQSTVDLVMGYLVEHPNLPHSLENLSDAIGLSRVTMRRYMNHLVTQGVVEGSIFYATGGRPSSVYCYRPKK